MAWIGLIDDSGSRFHWLRDLVEPHYNLVYSPRVTVWLKKVGDRYDREGPAELMVYDHDLGIGSFEDVDGHNGMDALTATQSFSRRTSLIWSTNDEARARMLAWCRQRSYTSKAIPFRSEDLGDVERWLRFELKLPGAVPADDIRSR